jgi:hypothetical protein
MDDTIAFTEEAVTAYLDAAIAAWRKRREEGDGVAVHYVDAFQSVRTSLFGEALDVDPMIWHHHHMGDMEFGEHFDIADPDPTDYVDDNIVVHAHEVPHFPGKEPCDDGCILLRGREA